MIDPADRMMVQINGLSPVPTLVVLRTPDRFRAFLVRQAGRRKMRARNPAKCPIAVFCEAATNAEWHVLPTVAIWASAYCELPEWARAFVRAVDGLLGSEGDVTPEVALAILDRVTGGSGPARQARAPEREGVLVG